MEGHCFFSHLFLDVLLQSSAVIAMLDHSIFFVFPRLIELCLCGAGAGAHPVGEFHVGVSDAGGGFRHDQQVQ